MAVLDRIMVPKSKVTNVGDLSGLSTFVKTDNDLQEKALNFFKKMVVKEMWEYFNANANQVIFRKKVLFYTFDIKISDIRFLFVQLFGEPEKTS